MDYCHVGPDELLLLQHYSLPRGDQRVPPPKEHSAGGGLGGADGRMTGLSDGGIRAATPRWIHSTGCLEKGAGDAYQGQIGGGDAPRGPTAASRSRRWR
ncbi:hypothetical protein E2562_009259 [Oryza meyeriana var. granulata]|uniref:Uncharacterized protein n=1 Tax=Oryza meyeriana var. granulata TaxID=110450 RepID=A0A6G1D1E4_9ORYZ|nr:hypothetical protein E2562_009259 [Oryza meyeriana var. granulata]